MGRGGGGRGRGGGGDKVEGFFAAIEIQKIETVRWSIVHGGILLTTCNDNGETGLMVAATLGKEKSLDTMLEQVRRMRSAADRSDCLDARDGEGKTPLMMAAARGRVECVKLLMAAGAKLDLKDEEGFTARSRAEWAGKQAVMDVLDGKEEEESSEDDAAQSDGGFEGETATQRRKRKKRELAGGGLTCSALRNAKKKSEVDDEAEEEEIAAPLENSKPVLPEIADALAAAEEEERTSGSVKELKMSLLRTTEDQVPGLATGAMDPALWRCGSAVRHLEIRWRPGLCAGSIDRIGSLKRILHLVIQDSGLPALPDAICELREMRSLEVDGNGLTTFPSSMKQLAGTLESVSAARNKLTSACLGRLAPLDHLVSLKLDHNALDALDDLALNGKSHLVTLSVAHNKLESLPDDPWADLAMLQHLNVSSNKITELPCEMGAMKEKKLTELLLFENPWKDGKIRNMIENSAVLSNTVLVYLRKLKPKGKKQAKPKRRPAKADSDSDPESDPEKVAPEAQVEDHTAKKGKKKSKGAKANIMKAKDECKEECSGSSEDEETRLARVAAAEEAKRLELEERRAAAAAKRAQKEAEEQKFQQKAAAAEQARATAQLEKEQRDKKKADNAAKQAEQEDREKERRSKMSPEQLKAEEEQAESERRAREQELADLEKDRKAKAETQAAKNKQKVQQRENELNEDDAKFKFVFYGGKMHKQRIDAPSANAQGKKTADVGKGGRQDGGKAGHASGGKKEEMNFVGSIDVPKELVGRLIGQGGSTIKELCTSTGAYITIPKDHPGDPVQVEIKGGKKSVDMAVERISELLMRR